MRKRFGDVKRGAVLNTAYTRYLQRLANPERFDPGSRGDRPPRQVVTISPYGFGNPESTKVLASRPQTQGINMDAYIKPDNKCSVTIGAASGAQKIRGFIPAQVTIQLGDKSKRKEISKFTGLPYLKYTGLIKGVSPFGRAAVNHYEFEARDSIRAAVLALQNPVKRVSFRAEQRLEYS